MQGNGQIPLPPVLERYELKYVIAESLIEPISRYLAPYCSYDDHSLSYEDGFYPVNSLYFDTINYRFLKLRMWGVDRRFNMRVRSYGDGCVGPFFAEVKFKSPTSIKKYRATLASNEWPEFLSRPGMGGGLDDARADRVGRNLFLQLAESYAIEPKIFTSYRRRAFVSQLDVYARVTMDVDMRYRNQTLVGAAEPFSLRPDATCVNYDVQTIYADEVEYGANVVLELKATAGAIPLWMIELVRRFQLKQVGFSKYLNSCLIDNRDNGLRYMEPATTSVDLSA